MAPKHLGGIGSLSSFKRLKRRPPLSPIPIELVSQHPNIPDSIRGLLEKTGGRKGTRPTFSRVLQLTFSGSKIEQLLETGHRSQSVKHFSDETYVQNGNTSHHLELHQAHAMGSISGPGRCILPCSHPPQLQEVSVLCLSRPGLPVLGHAIWFGYSPTSFYQNFGAPLRVHGTLLLQY